jgi:hypothetical protein
MKKNLQILLQLDGLVLTRKVLELKGIPIRKGGAWTIWTKKLKSCAGVCRRRWYRIMTGWHASMPIHYPCLPATYVRDASSEFPDEPSCWRGVPMKLFNANIVAVSFLPERTHRIM